VILALAAPACRGRDTADKEPMPSSRADAQKRQRALEAARVWTAPTIPPGKVDFAANTMGPGVFDAAADVDCEFVLKTVGGTSPKFYCRLPDGDVVKVKYGEANAEVPAEVAATRLMHALGFFVDRMMLVKSVRCRGCPPFPAQALACLEKSGVESVCLQGASRDGVKTFDHAVIERQFAGKKIEGPDAEGWAWFELDRINPKAGGAPRRQVDALRIVAVVLAHWDNKAENQRLVCPDGGARADGSCSTPLAVVHDLGATFGPRKADLQNWKQAPVWADPASCRLTMTSLPYKGGTFGEPQVTEEGRALAVKLLRLISPAHLNTLFEASGFSTFPHVLATAREPQAWTDVFLAKVEEVARAGPCPRGN
jgi:hypothetical protein